MSRGHRHLQSRLLRAGVQRAKRRAEAAAAEEAARTQAAAAAEAAHNQAELDDTLNQICIWAHMLPNGDNSQRSLDLLRNLAWCIGLGASVAVALDPMSPQARRLHGATRTVHGLCLSGYRWRPEFAPALEAAAREANAVTMANPDLAQRYAPDAFWLAERIQTRQVAANDVAGAEVYRKPAPQEATAC